MKTVAVTGITGKSGQFLMRRMMREAEKLRAYHFLLICRKTPAQAPDDEGYRIADELLHSAVSAEIVKADVSDPATMQNVFQEHRVDMLLHIAGVTLSDSVVPAAMAGGVNDLILVHTTGIYSKYKAAGEAYVLGFTHGYGTQFPEVSMTRNIIRPGYTFGNPAWTDGCSQPDRRFFSMAQAVKENRDINIIKNDGTQFIHASQQAQLYMSVLESDKNEEIYLGLGEVWMSWKEIAEMMISLKPGCKSKVVETDLGWGDEPMLFDVSKIQEQFGLAFDAHEYMMDHVKWTYNQV